MPSPAHHEDVSRPAMALRKPVHASTRAVNFEQAVYKRGLKYQRPTLTFQSNLWEEQACGRLSAEAKGYVYGSAGQRPGLHRPE